MRARIRRLRAKSWAVGQCAVAAGLAWFVGQQVLGHTHPYFAPIVALISLGTSYGQRLRRVVEVTVGVAVGVFLGDLYTHVLGRGPWQIAVMVGMSIGMAMKYSRHIDQSSRPAECRQNENAQNPTTRKNCAANCLRTLRITECVP